MKNILKKIVVKILTFEAKIVLKKYKPRIVAITGSVGKTSTKDAVFTALQTAFHVRKTEKSFNSEIGIPLTILGLPNAWNDPILWFKNIIKGLKLIFKKVEYPEWLVLEVGADRPGDIAFVSSWVPFDIAVFTRIGKVPVHVEFYDSVQEVVKEKSALLKGLKKDGVAILNQDDEDIREFKKLTKNKCLTFSLKEDADVKGSFPSIVYEQEGVPKGMAIKVDVNGNSFPVVLQQVLGAQHLLPVVASFAVALSLNLNLIKVSSAFMSHTSPRGRMNIIAGKQNSVLIDDTYNASPVAVEEAFTLVDSIETKKRKVAILGDMLELGRHCVEEHERLGKIASEVFDEIIAVGVRAKDFLTGARQCKMKESHLHSFSSSLEAISTIGDFIKEGDIVFIKGSQGARMERIVEKLMLKPEDKDTLLVRQEEEWQHR